MLSIIYFINDLRRHWSSTSEKGSSNFPSSVFAALSKGIRKQSLSKYNDLKGLKVICFESYLDFEEDVDYLVSHIDDFNIYLVVNKTLVSLSFNEFDNCLEY